jgi:LPXTG-site transpeptidase (sortase) family protein
MRASASILSLLVGALVTVVLAGWASGGAAVGVVPATSPRTAAPHVVRPDLEVVRTSRPQQPRLPKTPQISIPRLDLVEPIGTDVDAGPAWWPVTGRPGGGDTVAIAGHRTTHTRPFYWLDRLRPGDAIYLRWAGRMHAYEVSGRRILSARDLHIADARGHEVLLLSACTPRGSARQRIVVYAWPRG